MAWTVSSVRVRAPRIALCVILGCLSLLFLPSRASRSDGQPADRRVRSSADHNRTVRWCRRGRRLRAPLLHRRRQPAAARDRDRKAGPASPTEGSDSTSLRSWACGRSSGVVYEARVAAVGPGGSTASTISNQFVFPGTTPPPPAMYAARCPRQSPVAAAAITGSVSVTAGTGCAWTASSSGSWLSITGGGSRLGQRHDQLQRGRQHRIVGAVGDADRGQCHLHPDAERGERVVRVLSFPRRRGRSERPRRRAPSV